MQNIEKAYNKAPKEVQRILNCLEPSESYEKLDKANKLLLVYNYQIDYYLTGDVTRIYKVKNKKN